MIVGDDCRDRQFSENSCYSLSANYYINKPTMLNIIEITFCNEGYAQGKQDYNSDSIARTYYPGTMDEFELQFQVK